MPDVTSLRAWLYGIAFLTVLMLLFHGNATAAAASCAKPTVTALALGTTFEPPALVAGTQIVGTVSGTCKNDTANSLTITFSTGANAVGANRAMKCTACAGPTPFFLLQYQLFESGGAIVFPAGGVTVSCTTSCMGNGNGTYSLNFVAEILQPLAATSLNDSQIGSYSDTNLKATATPTTAGTASTSNAVTTTATVIQFCTISTTTNIAFGAYDPLTVSGVTDNTGVVTVTCTRGNSGITLTVGGGGHAANAKAPSTRAMIGAAHGDFISYDIFETAAYATHFPTTAVAQTITGGVTTPSGISLFGQIPAAPQDVSVDSYSDTVLTTVNF
jgi:spore coat protein U-like protein